MRRPTIGRRWIAAGSGLALAATAGCAGLGPPVQHARTGETVIRVSEPTTPARLARIAWGDSTLGPSVAALARIPADGLIPGGTVVVLPPRDRLDARVREALAATPGHAGGRPAGGAAPGGAALSVKQRRDVDALFRSAETAMEEGRVDDALRDWERVWRQDAAYPGVVERLEHEYQVRGLEAFSGDHLAEAIELWERALEIDPTDEKTRGYLRRAREQQSRSDEILGTGASE